MATGFLRALPSIREELRHDARAALDGDPAARSVEEVILTYPGFEAIMTHRVAHWFYDAGVPFLPRAMAEHAPPAHRHRHPPRRRIGRRFFIDHGTGVVIGGNDRHRRRRVRIYQGVTLGALSVRQPRRRQAPPDHRGRRRDLRRRHRPGRRDGHRPQRDHRWQCLNHDVGGSRHTRHREPPSLEYRAPRQFRSQSLNRRQTSPMLGTCRPEAPGSAREGIGGWIT
ncbi:MAG: hypothetical protein R3F43_01555 [bacterium]